MALNRTRSVLIVVGAITFLSAFIQLQAEESPFKVDCRYLRDVGYLTWTNINPSLYYTVEYRPNLEDTDDWDGGYRGLQDIQTSNAVITVPVARFFRVVGSPEPRHTRTLSLTSTVVVAGYYEATTLPAVDPNLTAENILGGTTIFGIQGMALPATGDATPEHVLEGRTFSNTEASGATGAMPNRGAQNITPGTAAQAILQGYHAGTGSVAGDPALASGNIRSGISIFGVAGSPDVVDTSSGTASAGDLLIGETAWVGGAEITGTRPYAPVPRTGQTNSYFAGDDGDLRVGVYWPEPRFTTNLNLTVVRDNLTGLEWLMDANAAGVMNWTNALLYCNGLVVTSVWTEATVTNSDWRLPNRRELLSLVDDGCSDPALPVGHPFIGVQSADYWSGTTYVLDDETALKLSLHDGLVASLVKTDPCHVWPVRAGLIDYLVVDLSGGPSASSYPVSYLTSVPSGGWTEEYKTTRMVFRRIPSDTFIMGSPDGELERWSNETQHQVTLTEDFYIGVFQVTQKQWERVMGDWPSHFNNTTHRNARPVEQVSYNMIRGSSEGSGWPANSNVDATSFMGRLRSRTGRAFDLPTESQWEYAARAGTTTALNSGMNLTATDSCPNMNQVGRYWYNGGSGYSQGGDTSVGTSKVGSYQSNNWGLYDMHGNVWEWCLDWYGTYPGTVTNPNGSSTGSYRVVRGGSWGNPARDCRSAGRYDGTPDYGWNYYGFRVALPPDQ